MEHMKFRRFAKVGSTEHSHRNDLMFIGQHASISWFPKQNTWASSGYNVGQWTKECEDWFVNRLDAIRKGEAQPFTATVWRNKLRLTRNAPKLAYQMNQAAMSYLMRGSSV